MSEPFKCCPNCGSKNFALHNTYYHCGNCNCDFAVSRANGSILYYDKSSEFWVHSKPRKPKVKVVFS